MYHFTQILHTMKMVAKYISDLILDNCCSTQSIAVYCGRSTSSIVVNNVLYLSVSNDCIWYNILTYMIRPTLLNIFVHEKLIATQENHYSNVIRLRETESSKMAPNLYI